MSWWRRSVVLAALCLGSAAAGAYAALTLATAELENWGPWLRDFAMSPGAAAFAALVAAVIAFFSISRQVRVSQSALDHQRQDASQLAWWRAFEWTSGRALPLGQNDIPLPQAVSISTLESLVKAATTDVQRAACSGVIDVLSSLLLPVVDSDVTDIETAAEQDSSAAIDALVSYVEASGGTSAASSRAEAVMYEPRVAGAIYEQRVLAELSSLSSNVRAFREPANSNSRADAILEVDGKRVAVEISFARTPLVVRARARTAAHYRQQTAGSPLLLVSRFETPFSVEEEAELRVVVATWNSPADNQGLLDALRRAAAL